MTSEDSFHRVRHILAAVPDPAFKWETLQNVEKAFLVYSQDRRVFFRVDEVEIDPEFAETDHDWVAFDIDSGVVLLTLPTMIIRSLTEPLQVLLRIPANAMKYPGGRIIDFTRFVPGQSNY